MAASDVIAAERLEALLRGDGPRTADEARRAALIAGLRAAPLQAPETLRTRVLAAAPARRRRRPAPPPHRLALAAVSAALVTAVAAAAVHGIVRSGPRRAAPPPVAAQEGVAKAPPAVTSTGSGGVAAAPSSKAATPSVGSGGRLQHTDATLDVRVPGGTRLSEATTKATRIVTSLGGYAQSVVYESANGKGEGAELDLRVPAQNARVAIARLGSLGTIAYQRLSVQDLQHLLAAQSARIAALRRQVAALARAVADPSLLDAQRVLLRIKLAEAQRSLAQSLAGRKGTLASGAMATISLTLSPAQSPAAVVHHRGRFGRMLHSALGFLALEGTIALYALVVLSPLVVLGALAWWLAAARRRREERRLLAA